MNNPTYKVCRKGEEDNREKKIRKLEICMKLQSSSGTILRCEATDKAKGQVVHREWTVAIPTSQSM